MRCASTSVSVWDWKTWPFFIELRPKRGVVFDDAVVDEHEAPALVEMRVRILIGHAAMRRPARVRDADIAVRRICRDDLREIGDASDALAHFDASAVENGDARADRSRGTSSRRKPSSRMGTASALPM